MAIVDRRSKVFADTNPVVRPINSSLSTAPLSKSSSTSPRAKTVIPLQTEPNAPSFQGIDLSQTLCPAANRIEGTPNPSASNCQPTDILNSDLDLVVDGHKDTRTSPAAIQPSLLKSRAGSASDGASSSVAMPWGGFWNPIGVSSFSAFNWKFDEQQASSFPSSYSNSSMRASSQMLSQVPSSISDNGTSALSSLGTSQLSSRIPSCDHSIAMVATNANPTVVSSAQFSRELSSHIERLNSDLQMISLQSDNQQEEQESPPVKMPGTSPATPNPEISIQSANFGKMTTDSIVVGGPTSIYGASHPPTDAQFPRLHPNCHVGNVPVFICNPNIRVQPPPPPPPPATRRSARISPAPRINLHPSSLNSPNTITVPLVSPFFSPINIKTPSTFSSNDFIPLTEYPSSVPHLPNTENEMKTEVFGMNTNGQSLPSATNETRCNHRKSWKRLRSKRGFAYFACYFCGAKWRITTSGNPSGSDGKCDADGLPCDGDSCEIDVIVTK